VTQTQPARGGGGDDGGGGKARDQNEKYICGFIRMSDT